MTDPAAGSDRRWTDILVYFLLACGITWALDLRLVIAWLSHTPPPDYALPLVGLGALGPTLAALAVAGYRRRLRAVFGRWRTAPIWIVLGLAMAPGVHLAANLLEVALGGHPAQWFYPPVLPEHFAALVMFSVGEEFGWRGYAYPELERRIGAVAGSLLLGAVWGLWHLGMLFTPQAGAPALGSVAYMMLELALYSVVMAWFFERGNRSMAVAIAIHAGAHLDNVNRAPAGETRLEILRFLVLVVAAALAGRALSRRQRAERG